MSTFQIGDQDFLLDGKPHRVISGALHYFRVHPELWADRIHKARLMGLNTIETYVAWNAHEPVPGQWNETGWNDLARFLDLIAAEGLHAIVRPGPYICAEWHNGGLPVWLTSDPAVGLRRSEPRYLAAVASYLTRVYNIVAPRQIDRGGNVILVQIENEYGAYGADKDYLAELVRITHDAGITVPLTTVDQPQPEMLEDGSIPGLHKTGSFGSRAAERLATLRIHQPTGPLMCSEFWDGWFDWWGGVHHTTSPETSAADLDALLAAGASVNLYMFHGGTNFGLTNGANHKGRYLPLVTSYDYDAPLDEAGNPTRKYHAFREVIARYAPVPTDTPSEAQPSPVLDVALSRTRAWGQAGTTRTSAHRDAPTFEDVGFAGALLRYDTVLPRGAFDEEIGVQLLTTDAIRDHAWVSVDGRPVGTISRSHHQTSLPIPRGTQLSVLVEEQGRVNYDGLIGENKGLIGTPRLGGIPLRHWTVTEIDLEQVAADAELLYEAAAAAGPLPGPVAAAGVFELTAPADLYLRTDQWGRGFAFVNGLFLGRYSRNGPQNTLYVPAPATSVGSNSIVIIEVEGLTEPTAHFVAGPLLGPLEE